MADKPTEKLDRTPPQAPDIERAVLGAMLIDRDATGAAIEIFSTDDQYFYKPEHGMIYRAVTDLYDKNDPIDQLTVSETLRQRGQLEMIGGEATIASIIAETTSGANIDYHCRILKEKALLRRMISITTTFHNRCFNESVNTEEIMGQFEQSVMDLATMRHTKAYQSVSETVLDAYHEIENKAHAGDGVTGIDTGYSHLNHLTAGWQSSDLIVLAGRPSMGKTAFALELAKNAAMRDIPVAVFSLEMSVKQLVMRLLFNEGRFDGSFQNGEPTVDDWSRLQDACARLEKYPLYIDDTPGLSSIELSAKAKRLKAERDIGMIVVDYMQLMQGSNRESRQQEISAISRGLKILAKELNVPVIALSQLSRALEQRGGDHRPLLSDLRESGAIEQDADVVMFIYRAAVYENVSVEYNISDHNIDTRNVAEIIIRKQRNGPIGTVLLHWIKEHMKFAEFDYERTVDFM